MAAIILLVYAFFHVGKSLQRPIPGEVLFEYRLMHVGLALLLIWCASEVS